MCRHYYKLVSHYISHYIQMIYSITLCRHHNMSRYKPACATRIHSFTRCAFAYSIAGVIAPHACVASLQRRGVESIHSTNTRPAIRVFLLFVCLYYHSYHYYHHYYYFIVPAGCSYHYHYHYHYYTVIIISSYLRGLAAVERRGVDALHKHPAPIRRRRLRPVLLDVPACYII
jgi:hypothetical protein